MSGWLSNLTEFVDNTFDNVLQRVNSARSEIETEQAKFATQVAAERRGIDSSSTESLLLPWETDKEELQILSNDAMERMLKLSVTEENFTVAPRQLKNVSSSGSSSSSSSSNNTIAADVPNFDFTSFVPVALRLLELDPNLGQMHAKLMPSMNEEVFWCHYHYRIMYLRASIGLDGPQAKTGALGNQKEEDVTIFMPQYRPPASPSSGSNNRVEMAILARSASASSVGASSGGGGGSTTLSGGAAASTSKAEPTEEEKELAAAKLRRAEEAALAAEVEAELLGEDLDLDLDLDDLDYINEEDFAGLDGLDALNELEDSDKDRNRDDDNDEKSKAKTIAKVPVLSVTPRKTLGSEIGADLAEEDDIDSNLGGLTMDELEDMVSITPATTKAADAGTGTDVSPGRGLEADIEAELAASPTPARKKQ